MQGRRAGGKTVLLAFLQKKRERRARGGRRARPAALPAGARRRLLVLSGSEAGCVCVVCGRPAKALPKISHIYMSNRKERKRRKKRKVWHSYVGGGCCAAESGVKREGRALRSVVEWKGRREDAREGAGREGGRVEAVQCLRRAPAPRFLEEGAGRQRGRSAPFQTQRSGCVWQGWDAIGSTRLAGGHDIERGEEKRERVCV